MPVPETIREAKNILSERLLKPRVFAAIHGVGTGMITDLDYHLRIYVNDINAGGLAEAIQKALSLDNVPSLPSFVLGGDFANQFVEPVRSQVRDLIVDVVEAPLAVFAAATAPPRARRPIKKPPPPVHSGCQVDQPLSKFPAGVSVWRGSGPPATKLGTIGYFFTDNSSKYLLTCNHVVVSNGPSGVNNIGNVPITPVVSIGRNGTLGIGTLHEFIKINVAPLNTAWNSGFDNKVDAAIVKMKPNFWVLPKITGSNVKISLVEEISNLKRGNEVEKHGAGTCVKRGKIEDAACDFTVFDTFGEQLFIDQLLIMSQTKTVKFADHGDSGSLVYRIGPGTDPKTKTAAGLLFAIGSGLPFPGRNLDTIVTINNGDHYALANPMETVLAELNAKLTKNSKLNISLVV